MNLINEWLDQTTAEMKIIIIGAGSLGKLTADCILRNNEYKKQNIAFLDNNKNIHGDKILGVKIIGSVDQFKVTNDLNEINYVIAIANNRIRKEVALNYPELLYTNVVSKDTTISSFADIGKGNIILPGTVIDPDARIKNHVIINKLSTIAHDVILNDYCQVAPGVNFGGYVEVGESSFIGLGSAVLPNKKIVNNVTVGAGSVVTKDIEIPSSVYIGNPAKYFKNNNK